MVANRISDLAKEHDMSSKAMLRMINELGFPQKSHLSKTTQEMIDAVGRKLDVTSMVEEPEAVSRETIKLEPVKDTKDNEATKTQEKVIFFSPSKGHNIAFKKETYFGNTVKIKEQAKSISFADYEYRTSDPEEIAWIKKSKSFTLRTTIYPQGKIRIVTEEQLAKLKIARMPRVKPIKTANEPDGLMPQMNVPETLPL